jgi:hypothetical protein
MTWDADDGQTGTATVTPNTSSTGWDFTWTFQGAAPTNSGVASPPAGGNVIDGTHTMAAQAFLLDAAGIARQRIVGLNRYLPRAPSAPSPNGGINARAGTIAELSWQQNPDTDIWGYQVYRAKTANPPVPNLSSSSPDAAICSTADVKVTTCFDQNPTSPPPTGGECPTGTPAGDLCASYYIVAFDKPWSTGNPTTTLSPCPPSGSSVTIALPLATTNPLTGTTAATNLRPGCPSQIISIDVTAGTTNASVVGRPDPPTALGCGVSTNGLTQVSWTAPSSPDPNGDSILGYRIYRDPPSSPPPYSSRTAVLSFTGVTGYTDPTPPGAGSHTYVVTSFDQRFAESDTTGASITCP